MVNLIAVQPEMTLANYESDSSFRQKIMGLCEEAVSGLPRVPTLVAFPELIGFPLLLGLQTKGENLMQSVKKVLMRSWIEILIGAFRHKYLGLSLIYLPSSLEAYRVYTSAFREASRTFEVTIVAGSSLLPYLTHEPALGLHIANPRVYNTSFVFSPKGQLLGQSQKVHLTPGLESRMGIARGRLQDLQVIHTPVGKVGVAICLDAFHDSVIGHFDGLGAEIIVQPSANNASWTRPWPKDSILTEGEAWFRYGLSKTLSGAQHLRYGVNPMLVGDLWDLKFEGLSSIVKVSSHQTTVISQATTVNEALVRATVDVHDATR
jgi:predicted amidohydrolase